MGTSTLNLQYGLSDVIGFMQDVTAYFPVSTPSAVSPTLVLAPLQSASTMQTMQEQVGVIVAAVIAGTMSVEDATADVEGMTTQLGALMPAANNAMTTMQAAKPTLAPGLAAGSMGLTNDPNLQTLSTLLAGSSPVLLQLQGEMASALPPALSSVSPEDGTLDGGTSVTLTGSNFIEGVTVTFGNEDATDVVLVSPTSITCVTPFGMPGLTWVIVETSGGVSNSIAFTFDEE